MTACCALVASSMMRMRTKGNGEEREAHADKTSDDDDKDVQRIEKQHSWGHA